MVVLLPGVLLISTFSNTARKIKINATNYFFPTATSKYVADIYMTTLVAGRKRNPVADDADVL